MSITEKEIRRLYVPDEIWQLTSESWRALMPRRNFNQISDSDETEFEHYSRLKPEFNIPLDVIDQWLYPHFYNYETVKNYGWIDYRRASFKKVELKVKEIESLNVIEDYSDYVSEKSELKPFIDFMCKDEDIDYWRNIGTWRIPPIVIEARSFPNFPEKAEIRGPLQLVEGHSRLGYFKAIKKSLQKLKSVHDIYLLKNDV